MSTKHKAVGVQLPPQLLNNIEEYCKENGWYRHDVGGECHPRLATGIVKALEEYFVLKENVTQGKKPITIYVDDSQYEQIQQII